MTFLWNEVTMWWNEVTKGWNEMAWNEVVMEQSDRNSNNNSHSITCLNKISWKYPVEYTERPQDQTLPPLQV